jgi:putative ABC transport system permease protein
MPPRFPFSDRLYRALLCLFPADFRGDFGSEMEEVFRDQRREAELKGKIGLLRLWGSTLAGALRIGPREHWDMLRQDAGYALRMMRRNPAFTSVAALVLAFGIGANTAVFSLVNGALLQPLPYANDRQLVFLRQQAPKAGIDSLGFSPNELADYRRGNQTLSDLVEYHSMSFILLGRDEPEQVQTGVVSANFFDVLGVKPLLGRTFLPHEEHTGAEPVLVLSYDYWQRSHGGDRNIVGRVFKMNDRSHMVIGVLPPVPQFPQENDVYMAVPACPFRSNPRNVEQRTFRLVSVFGRLRPEAQLPQAQADLSTAAARMAAQYPEAYPAGGGFAIRATPLKEELTQNARLTFLILLGTAGLVLLIACANVANLMLARVLAREREMAVRAAIGASRGRLVRQMVTESMILALAGGAAGLLLAAGSLNLLVKFAARFTPRAAEVAIDSSVLWFTLIASVVTGLAFGIIPALSTRRDLAIALGQGSSRAGSSAGSARARSVLVVAQVAISFVLVIGAGLMVRSLLALSRVHPGFNADRVLTMRINLNFSRYGDQQRRLNFGQALLQRLRTMPGVTSAALAVRIPLQNTFGFGGPVQIEGRLLPPGQPAPRVDSRIVSTDYFETIGQPMARGRPFAESDRSEAPPAAIINQRMARHFWGDEDPIGRRITRDGGRTWFTIVGVAGDVRQYGLDTEPRDEVYLPFAQNPGISHLLVRTSADPLSLARDVRQAVYSVDPEQAVFDLQTLERLRTESLAPKRLTTVLIGLFAGVALVITAAGIAGVMALVVNQRTQEIGIRIALGATPARVLRMVIVQGMTRVAAGLALGVAGSLAVTHMLRGLLYGVEPTDPLTFAGVSLVLAATAWLACYLPARRAASIDPMSALRAE